MGLLASVYLAIPPALPQPPGWSPRPEHASQVAELYRSHLGLSGLIVAPEQLRLLNPALLVLAAIAYVVALWSRPTGVSVRCLATVCAPLAIGSLLMPPLYATDIFYYGASGEIVARLGGNPYVLTPGDFPTSALLPFNYWTFITSPYGPIWTSVSAAAAGISAADPFLCTLLLKGVGLAGVLASGVLIFAFLRRTDPRAAHFGVMLFALNPVVWLLAVGDGHVDMLMAALVLGAACLLAHGRMLSSWCAIALATLAKYLTAPLLGLFFLARMRANTGKTDRWRVALLLGVSLVSITVVAWLPYWAGPSTLSSLLDEGSRGNSTPALLLFQAAGLPDGIADLIATCMVAGLLTWMLSATRHTLRRPMTIIDEVRTWALTMAAIPALLPRSHPWYFLTGIALLAAVYPTGRKTTISVYAIAGVWFLWRVGRL